MKFPLPKNKARLLLFLLLVFLIFGLIIFNHFFITFFLGKKSSEPKLGESLSPTQSPVTITRQDGSKLVIGGSCSELIRLFQSSRARQLRDLKSVKEEAPLWDINSDGKEDNKDYLLVIERATDESWCGTVLNQKKSN